MGDKTALAPLLRALREYVTTGKIEGATMSQLARFKEFVAELKNPTHDTDESYLRDISSDRPSRAALARELYLRCEPALALYPDFMPLLLKGLR